MSLKDRFAENFARSKTMSGPERKANELMGKMLLKKAAIPMVLILVISILGAMNNINGWAILAVNLLIAVGTFFYIRKSSQKLQNFKPIVGNLISIEQKDKKKYVAIIKQGKLPVKIEIEHGAEDLVNLKKNQMVQIHYNSDAKIAILVR